jgi:hypothetical protein
MNRLFCLFTIHMRRKNFILSILYGDKKWFIIVKFNYYEPFPYSTGDAHRDVLVLAACKNAN